ncbi:MAG: CheR family methyltransferase [Halanaerobiales bacterium]
MAEISNSQFQQFRKLIYDKLGISIADHKQQMIQARLKKVMRDFDISAFDDLYDRLTKNRNDQYWARFVHEITTHKTDFFREYGHFQFIQEKIDFILNLNRRIERNKEIRVWSAGCSTGEEPYTIAMILKEALPPDMNIKILATDISSEVIDRAQRGVYPPDEEGISEYYINKYFNKEPDGLHAKKVIKNLITFRTFNLMSEFPFKNKFDIIFCRNVMIYFDTAVQEKMIKKYYQFLVPGGLYFIGHSESLANKQYKFRYIQPTIYAKS